METTYAVSIWNITVYEGKRRKTYNVRWKVGKQEFRVPFKTRALADSFRSELLVATKKGEPFDATTGRPVSALRADNNTDWFTFASEYVTIKWPDSSPEHRRGIAEALTTITTALLASGRNKPDDKILRTACKTAFNLNLRDSAANHETAAATRWLERNTLPVADLAQPDVLRAVLKAITSTLDGHPAATSTARRKRMTLRNALDFAVEKKLLTVNPLHEVKLSPKTKTPGLRQIDRRSVLNPVQARTLLRALADLPPSGPRLVAFFATMYYSALRPEEAAALSKHHLSLPEQGWGELHLERARPEVAPEWTDSNTPSEERGLKHRDPREGRTVPCPPELTALLHEHLDKHGTAPDGRLFRATRHDGRISSTVYGRTWAAARAAVFTPEVLGVATGQATLRHPTRCCLDMAQGGCGGTQGRRVGRPQRSRPDARLRQIHRRRRAQRPRPRRAGPTRLAISRRPARERSGKRSRVGSLTPGIRLALQTVIRLFVAAQPSGAAGRPTRPQPSTASSAHCGSSDRRRVLQPAV